MKKEIETTLVRFPCRIRLCIDRYEGDLAGRIYSDRYPGTLHFKECRELLLLGDLLFDQCGYPQAFQERRSFSGENARFAALAPQEEAGDRVGALATVELVITSRRRAGWQGFVLRPDETFEVRFESELELLRWLQEMLKIKEE